MRTHRGFARALGIALAVAACSSGGGDGSPVGNGGGNGGGTLPTGDVSLTASNTFVPQNLSVPAGRTVVWVNAADVLHSITPDGHSAWARTTVDDRAETFSAQFPTAGTFPYYCEFHGAPGSGMHGTITVTP